MLTWKSGLRWGRQCWRYFDILMIHPSWLGLLVRLHRWMLIVEECCEYRYILIVCLKLSVWSAKDDMRQDDIRWWGSFCSVFALCDDVDI